MLPTSARLLRLLTLLQTKSIWTGAELADRLEITGRTLRRDIDRLRSLGYPVQGTVGLGGGYRLGAGASLPPLQLDDDEAVAVVLGLRTAETDAVSDVEDAAARALSKIEHLLPARLGRRVAALQSAIVAIKRSAPAVRSRTLTTLAAACHDNHRVSFGYQAHGGGRSRRAVEPHRLVYTGRRWYLVAWDADRQGWRTFRVDRVDGISDSGVRFLPRIPPDEDLAAYVSRGASTAPYPCRGRVLVFASKQKVAEHLPPEIGHLEPAAADRCVLTIGSRSWQELAAWLGVLGFDLQVIEPHELAIAMKALARRFARAARG